MINDFSEAGGYEQQPTTPEGRDLFNQIALHLQKAHDTADQKYLFKVFCHESAPAGPDGALRYIGSHITGRFTTLAQARKHANYYNALARDMGYINLKYEILMVVQTIPGAGETGF